MTVEQAIKEAYRRGAAAMYDMGCGGLSHIKAWRKICTVSGNPPNVRDLLEQFRDKASEPLRGQVSTQQVVSEILNEDGCIDTLHLGC